ncbi:hypothetical protein LTR62_005210 [Meristemomyces frigidus]|uniref:Uncharacterized protein n=1 Tax=Meristemomyces frigidus TaxID=1508187 RepID=A0AAN7TF74_9PEZI|nr:hypothetical protein LTR62_005210 [Meristemomyces frigidus]
MEWQSSMGGFQPQQTGGDDPDEENEPEYEEDFYGDGNGDAEDAQAGAAVDGEEDASADLLNSLLPQQMPPALPSPQTPQPKEQTISPEEKKLQNQRTAQRLREQLLAKRQQTPMKAATSAVEAPPKMKALEAQQNGTKAATPTPTHAQNSTYAGMVAHPQVAASAPVQDTFGLDSLIAEGQRAGEAKAKELKTEGHAQQLIMPTVMDKPTNQQISAPAQPQPSSRDVVPPSATITVEQSHPQQLNNAYYTDLSAWLELTGYHDVEYRTSKLRTRRERQALEDEVARIQAKLEQLRQQEAAEMQALRTSVAPVPSTGAAPPLPTTMPPDAVAKTVFAATSLPNGVPKRPHSPILPVERNTRRREEPTNGFRIRGANGSDTSPRGEPDRRNSYEDARRSSITGHSRDASIERRQSYYRRDVGPAHDRYDSPYPPLDMRDGRPTPQHPYENRTPDGGRRGGYAGGRGRYPPHPRGSSHKGRELIR